MTTINEKKLEKWAGKYKKHILIISLFVIFINILLFISSKMVDENFDIIRIDEGKTPYKKVKSKVGDVYSILLRNGKYEFSLWNITGEQKTFSFLMSDEGSIFLDFMNLNDSSTSVDITSKESITMNLDIRMDGGNVDIEINAPGSTANMEISGTGTVKIYNASKYQISIIVNGEKIILGPRETYIWEG